MIQWIKRLLGIEPDKCPKHGTPYYERSVGIGPEPEYMAVCIACENEACPICTHSIIHYNLRHGCTYPGCMCGHRASACEIGRGSITCYVAQRPPAEQSNPGKRR